MTGPSIGALGEELATLYLRARGYRIVERNYRCTFGEIDVVAEEGGELVFVEVKTRHSESLGSPAEAVNAWKRRQITRTAQHFLKRYSLPDRACRFDVVGILLPAGQEASIELVRGAFDGAR